jgi:RimJ/RimL family protein N-acetyltransferase
MRSGVVKQFIAMGAAGISSTWAFCVKNGGQVNTDLFTGNLVHLRSVDPPLQAEAFWRWDQQSEFMRLLNREGISFRSKKKNLEWFEKDLERQTGSEFLFLIYPLDENLLIGFVFLMDLDWTNGDAWVAIGIGESEYQNKGYGSDTMGVVLRYAFMELNLHRVSLGVFAYNQRAIRSYEKVGFKVEGLQRMQSLREGQRSDVVLMGILRQEWEVSQL